MECSILSLHIQPKKNLGEDQHSWGAVISQTKGVILGQQIGTTEEHLSGDA